MTRGKFILITDKAVFISTEFNGDMYPEGHGLDVFKRLIGVKDIASFMLNVSEFNSDNFEYEEILVREKSLKWLNKVKDFSKGYFENWFSDWLYIKNISSNPVVFTTLKYSIDGNQISGEERVVMPEEVAAFNFGDNPSQEDKDYLERNI